MKNISRVIMIGLQKGIVKLAPYTEKWAKIYQDEEKILWEVIGEYVTILEKLKKELGNG
jgi:hypothetical protein